MRPNQDRAVDRRLCCRLLLGLASLVVAGCNALLIEAGSADGAVTPDDQPAIADTLDVYDTANVDAGLLDGSHRDVTGFDGLDDLPLDIPTSDLSALDTSVPDGVADVPIPDVGRFDVAEFDGQDGGSQVSGCATAPLLNGFPGIAYSGSTSGSSEYLPGCSGASSQGGPIRWYRVEESTNDVIVTATSGPEAGNPLVRFYEDCPPMSCAASSANPRGLATVQTLYAARGRHPYYVAVSSDRDGAPSDFAFQIGIGQAYSQPNGVCAAAMRVHNGDILHGQNLSDGMDSDMACGFGALAALYYIVTVPIGQTLRVGAYNDNLSGVSPSPLPGMHLSPECDSTTCLASGTPTGYTGESRVRWSNTSALPQDVILAIDSGDPHVYPFSFELVVTIQPSG